MSDARYRPILFSPLMVRAILDGRRKQTRRVVNGGDPGWPHAPTQVIGDTTCWGLDGFDVRRCPYGAPGDRLWVRESWRVYGDHGRDKASTSTCTGPDSCEYKADFSGEELEMREWRPSIYMPRWASRITLKVTGVRVERVQQISEEDAIAEGCPYRSGCGCRSSRRFFRCWS